MNRKTTIVISIVFLAALLLMIWQQRRASLTENLLNQRENPSRSDLRETIDPKKSQRVVDKKRLQECWMEVQSEIAKGVITPELQALATETAESLLCSAEMLQLLEFLEEQNMQVAAELVRSKVSNLFATPWAPEARALLANLSATAIDPDNIGNNSLERWSFAAGEGCDEAEFGNFHDLLKENGIAQSALLGRNVTLARTNPEAAFSSVIQALSSGQSCHQASMAIPKLVENLPEGVDFEKIDKLFPPHDKLDQEDYFSLGRDNLFRKWANVDPSAAVNHITDSPERVDPGVMTTVVDVVLGKNLKDGIEWVKTFPKGPYFDAAAQAAISRLARSNPAEANRMAEMIENPKLREASINQIKGAQIRKNRREGSPQN